MSDSRDDKFERERLAFIENNLNLRQLNGILWQIPLLAMALTGGLWFGIISYKQNIPIIPILLLLFAGVANVVFTWILARVRDLVSAHIDKVKDFHPEGFPTAPTGRKIWQRDRFVVRSFSLMMIVIAFLNFLFAGILIIEFYHLPMPEALRTLVDSGRDMLDRLFR